MLWQVPVGAPRRGVGAPPRAIDAANVRIRAPPGEEQAGADDFQILRGRLDDHTLGELAGEVRRPAFAGEAPWLKLSFSRRGRVFRMS